MWRPSISAHAAPTNMNQPSFMVNGMPHDQYFSTVQHRQMMLAPLLVASSTLNHISVDVDVRGGGTSSQVCACVCVCACGVGEWDELACVYVWGGVVSWRLCAWVFCE